MKKIKTSRINYVVATVAIFGNERAENAVKKLIKKTSKCSKKQAEKMYEKYINLVYGSTSCNGNDIITGPEESDYCWNRFLETERDYLNQ